VRLKQRPRNGDYVFSNNEWWAIHKCEAFVSASPHVSSGNRFLAGVLPPGPWPCRAGLQWADGPRRPGVPGREGAPAQYVCRTGQALLHLGALRSVARSHHAQVGVVRLMGVSRALRHAVIRVNGPPSAGQAVSTPRADCRGRPFTRGPTTTGSPTVGSAARQSRHIRTAETRWPSLCCGAGSTPLPCARGVLTGLYSALWKQYALLDGGNRLDDRKRVQPGDKLVPLNVEMRRKIDRLETSFGVRVFVLLARALLIRRCAGVLQPGVLLLRRFLRRPATRYVWSPCPCWQRVHPTSRCTAAAQLQRAHLAERVLGGAKSDAPPHGGGSLPHVWCVSSCYVRAHL